MFNWFFFLLSNWDPKNCLRGFHVKYISSNMWELRGAICTCWHSVSHDVNWDFFPARLAVAVTTCVLTLIAQGPFISREQTLYLAREHRKWKRERGFIDWMDGKFGSLLFDFSSRKKVCCDANSDLLESARKTSVKYFIVYSFQRRFLASLIFSLSLKYTVLSMSLYLFSIEHALAQNYFYQEHGPLDRLIQLILL